MPTNLQQQRQDILQQIQAIQRLRRGSFSRQHFPAKHRGGPAQGPYFVLQGYLQGRKCSERIPAERAAQVEQDVKNYQRFQQLADQFVTVTDQMTCQADAPTSAKKNSRSRKSRTSSSGKPAPS
ncbi:MAG: hypothetical protein KGS61_13055 [Verrucomicrobia bacterium]|nr:hypothetical protein [Verrucomicrobiota bacterium]